MISFGIGYGQVKEFTLFIKEQGFGSWENMSDEQKKESVYIFLKPKPVGKKKEDPPESCTFGKALERKEPEKSDILSHYTSNIKPLFRLEELFETAMSEVFLTSANRNGWLLEIVEKTGKKVEVPFIQKKNIDFVVSKIWAEYYAHIRETAPELLKGDE